MHHPADRAGIHPAAAYAEEKGGAAGRGHQHRTARLLPQAHRADRGQAHRDGALLAALAEHAHRAPAEVERPGIQAAELADPGTGGIQQFQYRGVPQRDGGLSRGAIGRGLLDIGCGGGQHVGDLALAEHVRQRPADLRRPERRPRVSGQPATTVRERGE